jgi:hypothetical protein
MCGLHAQGALRVSQMPCANMSQHDVFAIEAAQMDYLGSSALPETMFFYDADSMLTFVLHRFLNRQDGLRRLCVSRQVGGAG